MLSFHVLASALRYLFHLASTYSAAHSIVWRFIWRLTKLNSTRSRRRSLPAQEGTVTLMRKRSSFLAL